MGSVKVRENRFKAGLLAGRQQIGIWSSLASPVGADIIAASDFDWVLIDMEHSPNELFSVLTQLQVYDAGKPSPIVRVPWNEPVIVKRLLDIGANSLLFPMVRSPEEAAQAVAATRYPPKGVRGLSLNQRANRFGRVKDYVSVYEQEICVLVQIETRGALEHIEEIAGVEGVDAVFFGPADLSSDMGLLGQPAHAEVKAAILDGLSRCKKAGRRVGLLSTSEADSLAFLKAGFDFISVGSDTALLTRNMDALAERMRAGMAG
jgi:4-hydroxy-2-oxoheptanedioate aldolase